MAKTKIDSGAGETHFFVFRALHSLLLPIVCHPLSNEFVAGFQRLCGIDAKGNVGNKLLFYIFRLASTTGEEIFSLMPLLFWLSVHTAMSFSTNFMIVLTCGQLVKDVLLLPRPPKEWTGGSRPIAKLEKHFETEYGFPSTHTMSGLFPMVVLMALQRRGVLFSDNWWTGSWVYVAVVAASRLYMGVHSPLDIVGGFFLGCVLIMALDQHGDTLDHAMYQHSMGICLNLLLLLVYIVAYPKARPWSASFGTATQIFGSWIGIAVSLWFICNCRRDLWDLLESVALTNSTHKVTFRGSVLRVLSGFVLVGLAKVGVKFIAMKLFLWLHKQRLLPSDPREEVDAKGQVVPPEKLYWVEVPVRLVDLFSLLFRCC